MEEVSDRLGNTPAIARKSYVHPAVVALVDRQHKWRKGLKLPRKTKWLSGEERGLLELLEASPGAEASCSPRPDRRGSRGTAEPLAR